MKTFDAQAALGFVISQTSHIETAVNEATYPDIQYPGLVPVDTSAHPFAKSVTYYSSDKFGKADWINGNSDDIPLAGTERTKHETQIFTAAIGYSFGWEEVGQAQMLGINLQGDDASAARRAYEEMVDEVVFLGDARKGFVGVFNNPTVPIMPATIAPNWTPATDPLLIISQLNAALSGTFNATLTTAIADTLLIPWQKLQMIMGRAMSVDNPETIFNYFLRQNIYTAMTGQRLTIRGMRGLDTAGTSGTSRMVAYRRHPDVLKVHIPMTHRFLGVHQDGPLRWVIPGVFRLGGVDIRRPKEVIYVDGI